MGIHGPGLRLLGGLQSLLALDCSPLLDYFFGFRHVDLLEAGCETGNFCLRGTGFFCPNRVVVSTHSTVVRCVAGMQRTAVWSTLRNGAAAIALVASPVCTLPKSNKNEITTLTFSFNSLQPPLPVPRTVAKKMIPSFGDTGPSSCSVTQAVR